MRRPPFFCAVIRANQRYPPLSFRLSEQSERTEKSYLHVLRFLHAGCALGRNDKKAVNFVGSARNYDINNL